jgi:hypothetical protein
MTDLCESDVRRQTRFGEVPGFSMSSVILPPGVLCGSFCGGVPRNGRDNWTGKTATGWMDGDDNPDLALSACRARKGSGAKTRFEPQIPTEPEGFSLSLCKRRPKKRAAAPDMHVPVHFSRSCSLSGARSAGASAPICASTTYLSHFLFVAKV